MEKKLVKKILAILMVIMILFADFYVLGSSLITYALTLDSATNHENIEFSAFFKNEKGERVEELETSIKADNLKLYAEVTVKNDGYLNSTLELSNSNFNIKNEILSDAIAKIEDNKVTLKQINAGTTVEIELGIEPIIADTMAADMLLKASDLKLTGTYMEISYKGLNIEATKAVSLNLQADASTAAELETDIITNKVLSINGTNKRVVQLLVKSRLTENQYPIKQTTINVNVPTLTNTTVSSTELVESVAVLSLGTSATNSSAEVTIGEWPNDNNTVQITVQNNDSTIEWNKDVYDEFVVTFIYPEDVDATKVEATTNSEITIHNSETVYTATSTKGIENKEPNGIITTKSEVNPVSIYKGQMYENINLTAEAKQNIAYNTVTSLVITNPEIAEKIEINEGPDVFATETTELAANTQFKTTEINKAKMLDILGTTGTIEIKHGETTTIIDSNTTTNESGNIVIEYADSISELTITTSKPAKAGILEINHSKVIADQTYSLTELKTINALKTKNTVEGTVATEEVDAIVVENATEATLELKETVSKAELTIKNNKDSLATLTSNELTLGVELITTGMEYDLYKNPNIQIKLPDAVESVTVNGKPSVLNAEGFDVQATYDNKTKIITIALTGEQKVHSETDATHLYIELGMTVTLSKTAPDKMDKIVMTYTNENATQYDGGTTDAGVIEKQIQISSPSGLITMHNSDTYNVTGIKGTSEDKQLVQVAKEDAGKQVNFDIVLINNTEENLNNIRIFGKLPTAGNRIAGEEEDNTLGTTLKNITASNATIYYSKNAYATANLEDTANEWTTTFSADAKLYLIKLDALNVETSYSASYGIQLPNPLTLDAKSYTEYQVIYNTESDTDLTVDSVAIGFATPTAVKMEVALTAAVGNDTLKNGDTVKVGEVVRYTMSVKNTGAQKIENIKLQGLVPEGTVLVEPEEGYVYSGASYYEELTEAKSKIVEIASINAGATYTTTYEVRIKDANTEISNKATAICDNTVKDTDAIVNTVKDSKVRVTIKRSTDLSVQLLPGGTVSYIAFIENLSEEVVNNLEIKFIIEGVEIINLRGNGEYYSKGNIPEKINISEVAANSYVAFALNGDIGEDADLVSANAIVTGSDKETYRSNRVEETLPRVDAEISMTSPQDKAYIKTGDTVEYNIVVENTGNVVATMRTKIPVSEYLEIKEIYDNGTILFQTLDIQAKDTYLSTISNDVELLKGLQPGEKATYKIVATVKSIDEQFEIKNITNTAQVSIEGVVRATSEEITHLIKGLSEEDFKNVISGVAWFDKDRDGKKENEEEFLSGIKVKIYNTATNSYLKDSNGNVLEQTTSEKGEYKFTKIENGSYIIVFEYDTNKYEPTSYLASGVDNSQNSKVILKTITIDGEEKLCAVTDTMNIQDNVFNINIGLKEKLDFDLQLNKYISRIVIQNSSRTKAYDFENETLGRVELSKKEVAGTVVVLEYTIKVKNNGEIEGYANNIVDYLTSGLTFNSELNPDWYLSGTNLYTKKLASEVIKPGEEKEVKLILTKTMTAENVGVVNNRAEIYETYNDYGIADINSTPNNNISEENDMGKADVIIGIKTGGTFIAGTILMLLNTALIIIAIRLMVKNNIIKIKRGRR